MGFLMLKESTTIVPAELGIANNTWVTVIAVGGGGGGGNCTQVNSNTMYIVRKGGAAGCGGEANLSTQQNSPSAILAGSGGGGGGYGAGGGGAGYTNYYYINVANLGVFAGGGGGGGDVQTKTFKISNASNSIAVTVAERAAAATNGSTTSFGSYVSALGGKAGGNSQIKSGTSYVYGGIGGVGGITTSKYNNSGGAGSSASNNNELYAGGGGGGGGFQIGCSQYGGAGGEAEHRITTKPSIETERTHGMNGQICGGGAGSGRKTLDTNIAGVGGPYGGGDGGVCKPTSNTDINRSFTKGQDGFAYLGDAGKGLVLLFW